MFFYDALDGVEAETGALSDALGGEKRFEDMGADVRWNSRTVVDDLDHDPLVIAIRADFQFALAIHGVDRIVDQVGPNLVEFAAE